MKNEAFFMRLWKLIPIDVKAQRGQYRGGLGLLICLGNKL